MNIYGSTGLGAAGTGEPSGGTVPGQVWSPEALAALQQMLGSGSQSMAPAASVPPQGGGTMTPMASLIGTGAPSVSPMSMSGAQMSQQPPTSQPQSMAQPLALPGQQASGTPNNSALFMQFMQALQNLQGKRSG